MYGFKEISVGDSNISFCLISTLDNAIYNYPVSVRRQLPVNWPSAIVSQNGKTIKSVVIDEGSKKYIMFDAIPTGRDILISKNDAASLDKNVK